MVTIEHLCKTYNLKTGNVTALKDVSLQVKKGEIYGIIGYSGAGKSTLVRCLNLLEKPDSGSVVIDGVSLVDTSYNDSGVPEVKYLNSRELNTARKKIGMIFQHFNLFDRRTVFDNIAYPLKYSGKSKEQIRQRVQELLELVDLGDKAYVYPAQLSGGQKQRVAIARALANNPKVLLSDEATSALDPEATEAILQLLLKLNKELGLTIVLITHEMSVIRAVCDKVAVMENGEVVEEGETYDIFADPRTPITRKFVGVTSGFSNVKEIMEKSPGGKLYHLLFTRDAITRAAISRVSREYDVDLDILLANIDLLRGGTLGRMLVAASGEKENIQKAFESLEQENVIIREVTEDAGDKKLSAQCG